MKILIINLHSSRNAGDDVLMRVSIDLLRHNFPGAEIVLAMNDPESCPESEISVGSFTTWVKSQDSFGKETIVGFFALGLSAFVALLYRFFGVKILSISPHRFRPLLNAYFESDLIVSSAGNFLYSSGRFGFAFLINIVTIAYAVLLGKPLYAMPQTLGPIKYFWEGWLLGWVAQRMRLVFVRDPISVKLLQAVKGWHDGCLLVPDVAFLFPGGEQARGQKVLDTAVAHTYTPRLGVTLINWQAQNRQFQGQKAYETAVSASIRIFIEQTNGQAILFSQVRGPTLAEDDRIPARRVHKMLADLGDQVVLIEEENVTADSLKAAYGLMDIFLGTRLHSNIFSLTSGTPAVMIQYQYKTWGIMEMLGLEEWVIDINEVSTLSLSEKLMSLWLQRQAVEKKILEAVTMTIQQIEQIGILITADYKTLS